MPERCKAQPQNSHLLSVKIWILHVYIEHNCPLFWDITPCSPLKVNRHLGGTYRLHLRCLVISQARNKLQAVIERLCFLVQSGFLLDLLLYPKYGGDMFSGKDDMTLYTEHGILYSIIIPNYRFQRESEHSFKAVVVLLFCIIGLQVSKVVFCNLSFFLLLALQPTFGPWPTSM
jgi:hypothetical protein